MQSLGHCAHGSVGLLVAIGPVEPRVPMPTSASDEMPGCMVLVHKMSPTGLPVRKKAGHGCLQLGDPPRTHLSGLPPHGLIKLVQLVASVCDQIAIAIAIANRNLKPQSQIAISNRNLKSQRLEIAREGMRSGQDGLGSWQQTFRCKPMRAGYSSHSFGSSDTKFLVSAAFAFSRG